VVFQLLITPVKLKKMNVSMLLIDQSLELLIESTPTITLHGPRPSDQLSKSALVEMLSVPTTTAPRLDLLFISQMRSLKSGLDAALLNQNGITPCLNKLLNGFGRTCKLISKTSECLSSLEIKMVLSQLLAPLTGLTHLAGPPNRPGLHGWMLSRLKMASK